MATISNNNIISMQRGDYLSFPLFINTGSEMNPIRYELSEGDKIYFGLMEPNQAFERSIFYQVYDKDSEKTPEGDIEIIFNKEDTIKLHPGKYYFEIKLEKNNGEITTIIPETQFFLM